MSSVTKRWIQRSRDEWQRLIDEQAESGQSQSTFCAARGISVGSLQNWRLASPEFSRQLTASQNTVAHRRRATAHRCCHAGDSGCRKTRCN